MAGMLAKAILPTGDRATMPLVPKDALVLNGRRRYVFVVNVNEDASAVQTVRSVPVVLGIADFGFVQVTGDLKVGDMVVVRGNERLRDGEEVTTLLAESSDVSVAN